ncbi:MAG: beta strand repeat-containing protein, partial [Saprospiraceae bacterium]
MACRATPNSWTGGATTQDRVGIGPGTYTVTVTDATGCTATKSATVGVLPMTAYNEQFNIANRGYLANWVDDFAGVDWTMSSWAKEPPAPFGRDMVDFFRTSGGVLVGEDFDQDICWESPVIDLNGGTQFSVDLAWTGFDNQSDEYINVKYSIDGGGYVTIPNVVGGGAGTIQYAAGLDQNGSQTVLKTGLSGTTIQIQVCAQFNSNNESMTIDNVNIPGSEPYCPGPEPTLTKTDVTCNGAANGTITTTVTMGTPPYTYAWSDGGVTTQNRTGLAPGTYTVTVTDANMLTGTASIMITEPPALVLTETHVNVLCNGASTGSIDLTVTGGTGAYTYSWTGGATSQDRTGLTAGTYTVTVTDANGCTKTLSVTITQPAAIVLTETHVDVLCNGNSTGSIDLTVSGGVTPYTYSWTGGATTQDRTGLTAGTYTVTVTDANACTKTLSVTITQPTAIVLSTTQVNVLCNGGSTGSIDLTVSGGVTPYTYSWSNSATTEDLSGIAAGTYGVTVTDANACTKFTSATITQPPLIVLTETHVNVLCNGASTGSIDLTVTGGVTAYTYSWTGGATTQDRSGLAAGTYTVTVTDANACTKTLSATLTEPAPMVLTTTTTAACAGVNNGTIDLTVSGGIGAYTYLWTGGATTQDLANLGAGIYTVTVTDANGCTKTTSATILQSPIINLSTTSTNTCTGTSVGTIDLTVTGGTPGFTYSWTGGATTQDISNLAAGTYTVTVTDANTCTKTISQTVVANPIPTVNAVSNQSLCAGTSTTAVTFSGTPAGVVFKWTNNNTSIGLAASGTGNIASFVAINNGVAPVVATITVTPEITAGGTTCLGTPITFTITVNPLPTVFNVTGGGVRCTTDNEGFSILLSGSQTGVNYQL